MVIQAKENTKKSSCPTCTYSATCPRYSGKIAEDRHFSFPRHVFFREKQKVLFVVFGEQSISIDKLKNNVMPEVYRVFWRDDQDLGNRKNRKQAVIKIDRNFLAPIQPLQLTEQLKQALLNVDAALIVGNDVNEYYKVATDLASFVWPVYRLPMFILIPITASRIFRLLNIYKWMKDVKLDEEASITVSFLKKESDDDLQRTLEILCSLIGNGTACMKNQLFGLGLSSIYSEVYRSKNRERLRELLQSTVNRTLRHSISLGKTKYLRVILTLPSWVAEDDELVNVIAKGAEEFGAQAEVAIAGTSKKSDEVGTISLVNFENPMLTNIT